MSHEVRETIRVEAIQKQLNGAKVKRFSEEYGTNESCIYRWIGRYRKGGMEALKTHPIAHSKNAKLSPDHQDALVHIILTKDPIHYEYYKAP
ncbi:helix-turn-helix domain containing protein [Sansalvadorimonas verongulae]|uniref:helix-turn-helix domain containing protein n=1 Tax=Sansalvadorimonas verongulae TaxID=2172824 RepID=UPI002E37C37E|nr:helix-turn-helix domain containing protein [Sansalvadorimonas verongulae]MTI12274.1 helix-turn-helix domain-containing protein [Sansalvadorimonas verongulae]